MLDRHNRNWKLIRGAEGRQSAADSLMDKLEGEEDQELLRHLFMNADAAIEEQQSGRKPDRYSTLLSAGAKLNLCLDVVFQRCAEEGFARHPELKPLVNQLALASQESPSVVSKAICTAQPLNPAQGNRWAKLVVGTSPSN